MDENLVSLSFRRLEHEIQTADIRRAMAQDRAYLAETRRDRARRYCEALQTRGILARDTHEHTIRIAPPLVVTSDQVDGALESHLIAGFLVISRRHAASNQHANGKTNAVRSYLRGLAKAQRL